MRRTIALLLLMAACGGSDVVATTSTAPAPTEAVTTVAATVTTTTAAPTTTEAATTSSTQAATTTTAAASGPADIRMEQLVFAGEPYLLIGNGGAGPGSTDGFFICQFPAYFALPAVTLQPGEKLAVPLAEGEIPELVGVVATAEATNPIGPIRVESGEIGLYSRSDFGSPEAVVDYVEWGNGGHGRSGVAVAAGEWVDGGFVELPEEVLAIVAEAFPTTSPDDWFAEIGG